MAARAEIQIQEVDRITPEVADAVTRLTAQLSSSARRPTLGHITEIVNSRATVLLIAPLVLFRIPTGVRALIEDVVVDQATRGRGVGEALALHAIARATQAGAKTIDLTSRPDREAANRLYQRLGFRKRDSNVYRYEPGTPGEDTTP